jgi:hypothetical protein
LHRILINKSVIIILLKAIDSLGIFVLLFLSVLYINTGYEDEEYQDCPDTYVILLAVFEARMPPILWTTMFSLLL